MFVLYGIFSFTIAFLTNRFAAPLSYKVFEPSPTATMTPTITITPTITTTPTITNTYTITPTLEFTSTPAMPAAIGEGFASEITPNPQAVFSNLAFARELTEDYLPIEALDTFEQPNTEIFGSFSYDKMTPGSQWTALWFREGELIYFESIPWNGASGGYGFTNLSLPTDEWLPGDYEVQIFAGNTWKTTGVFSVIGNAPTATPAPTTEPEAEAITAQVTEEAGFTLTTTPTAIIQEPLEPTVTPSLTPTVTKTMQPSATPVPTTTRRSTVFR